MRRSPSEVAFAACLAALGACQCSGTGSSGSQEAQGGESARLDSQGSASNDCVPGAALDAGGNRVCLVGADHRVRCAGSGVAMGTDGDLLGNGLESREDFVGAIHEELTSGVGPIEEGIERMLAATPQEARERPQVHRTVIPGIEDAVAVTVGGLHACAIECDGRLRCWGVNLVGQLGDGSTERRSRPVTPTGLPPVQAADAGPAHTCAVSRDGDVYCWGKNERGECGEERRRHQLTPYRVEGVDRAVDVAIGDGHSCARHADGTVSCWGRGLPAPRVTTGARSGRSGPVRRFELDAVRSLVSGHDHVCALREDGNVWCWGENSRFDGKVQPDSDLPDIPEPTRVKIPLMTAIAAGKDHTCGVTQSRGVHCWGADRGERLGRSHSPPPPLRDVAAGADYSCGLTTNSEVYCWGGLGHHLPPYEPRQIFLQAPER